ncbi:unnamed protein product [Nippostrongylus brasiliensis]|uniref:ZP domain-containing protein n=1 Tax=Nippostrongylus brasiliensis TaxID=27835 RepID=A0A0N4YPY6_NIPBR|nr:unnamed protein product [Nippostrongylus brasiliensis]
MLIGVLGVLLTLQPSIAKTLTGNVTCQGRPDTDAKFQPHFVYSLEDASHPSTHAYIAANVSGLFEVSFERTPLSIDYRIVHKCDYDDGVSTVYRSIVGSNHACETLELCVSEMCVFDDRLHRFEGIVEGFSLADA